MIGCVAPTLANIFVYPIFFYMLYLCLLVLDNLRKYFCRNKFLLKVFEKVIVEKLDLKFNPTPMLTTVPKSPIEIKFQFIYHITNKPMKWELCVFINKFYPQVNMRSSQVREILPDSVVLIETWLLSEYVDYTHTDGFSEIHNIRPNIQMEYPSFMGIFYALKKQCQCLYAVLYESKSSTTIIKMTNNTIYFIIDISRPHLG